MIFAVDFLDVEESNLFLSVLGEAFSLVISNADTILIWSSFAIGLGIIATAIHLWKYKND